MSSKSWSDGTEGLARTEAACGKAKQTEITPERIETNTAPAKQSMELYRGLTSGGNTEHVDGKPFDKK